MENNQINNLNENSSNILPREEVPVSSPIKKERKYSVLSITLSVVLGIIIILLGERLMYDLNRFINPVIDKDYTEQMNDYYRGGYSESLETPKTLSKSANMAMDSAQAVSKTMVYYKSNDKGRYMMYKSIIYAAVVIPIFIFAFVIFFLKKSNNQLKALLVSFLGASFWLMFHLLVVIIKFVMEAYKNIAVYVLLLILLGVFAFLAYYTQNRHSQEKGELKE